MANEIKEMQDRLKKRDEEMQSHLNQRLQAMEKKHNEEIAQLKASQGQQTQNSPAQKSAQPERNLTPDELMNNLRRENIKGQFARASQSWAQGAYDPQGAFWMQFWDFLFNSITEVLLRAGYIDPNKIAMGQDNQAQGQEETPRNLPIGSPLLTQPASRRISP